MNTTITSEFNVVIVMNIYLIIGIMITLLMYDKLVIEMTKKIEEDPLNFAGLSVNQVNNLVKYIPLATILVWPLFIIGFVQGFVESVGRIVNR